MTQAGIWSSTGNFFAISRVASIKNKNSLKYAKIPILECFKKHSEQLKLLALLQQFSEDVISFDHSPLKQREGELESLLGTRRSAIIRDFKIQRRDGNENVHKKNRFN